MRSRHGHPDFYKLCEEEMDLYNLKNYDYAKGGDPFGNFNRVSAILSLYPGLKLSDPAVIAIIYMLKQLDASLWMLSNGHKAKVEGHKIRWQDVSVYSKIISILLKTKRNSKEWVKSLFACGAKGGCNGKTKNSARFIAGEN